MSGVSLFFFGKAKWVYNILILIANAKEELQKGKLIDLFTAGNVQECTILTSNKFFKFSAAFFSTASPSCKALYNSTLSVFSLGITSTLITSCPSSASPVIAP